MKKGSNPQTPAPWANLQGNEKKKAREAFFAAKKAAQNPDPSGATSSAGGSNPGTSSGGTGKNKSGAPRVPRPPPVNTTYAGAVQSGSMPCFNPGTCPVIFSTGPGHATTEVHFSPVGSVIFQRSEAALNYVEQENRVITYEHELADDAARTRFRNGFLAAGVLAGGQSMVHSHVNARYPMGNFSALNGADLPHLRSVRILTSQWGNFATDQLGERVTPYSYEPAVTGIIRLAYHLIEEGPDTHDERMGIANRWWIPNNATDRNYQYVVALRFADAVLTLLAFRPRISQILEAMVTHQAPAWYAAFNAALPAAETDAYDYVWLAIPAVPANVVALYTGVVGPLRLARLGLEWANPNVNHLAWNMAPNAMTTVVLNAWSLYATNLERWFVTLSKKDMQPSAAGSPLQLSVMAEPAPGIVVVRSHVACRPADYSLSAAFHPTVMWDEETTPTRTVLSTQVVVSDEAMAWVQSDIK